MTEPSIRDLGLVCLKDGPSYAIFDRRGDISPETRVPGLYIDDTRFVSLLEMEIAGRKPFVLQSQVSPDNAELLVRMTNEEMEVGGRKIPEKAIQILRRVTVCDGLVHQMFEFTNRSGEPVTVPLALNFGADFGDMFNVRSRNPSTAPGSLIRQELAENARSIFGTYEGKDKVRREAGLSLSADINFTMNASGKSVAILTLPPGETVSHCIEYGKRKADAVGPSRKTYFDALDGTLRRDRARFAQQGPAITFSNPRLQRWFDRSMSDIAMLTNHYETGPYVCAGLPWFAVPFGRDGILTAMQMLWARPDIAKGTLGYLAAAQADREDPMRDADPGKIMHETRANELCNLGELPFSRYFGGVDTTMLFVVLAGQYLERTGDADFIRQIAPNVERALQWMETYGENADGFLTYAPKREGGLSNQNWMDSADSMMYEDGDVNVKFPRAVCEVQGYAYAAWKAGAKLAALMGDTAMTEHYEARAERLRANFNAKFWDEKKGYYYRTLDGDGRPCKVKGSNMGQLLFTGIVPEDRARRVAAWMESPLMFSGFGVRTLASDEKNYDEIGYHVGSIWPHDNGLIAKGLGASGHGEAAARIMEGMLDAAEGYGWRLPELFAGYQRTDGFAPADYPSACSPQAWSAAAPFQLLQAVLGLKVDAKHGVQLDGSAWKKEWGDLRIEGLQIGGKKVDVCLHATDKGAVLRPASETYPRLNGSLEENRLSSGGTPASPDPA